MEKEKNSENTLLVCPQCFFHVPQKRKLSLVVKNCSFAWKNSEIPGQFCEAT